MTYIGIYVHDISLLVWIAVTRNFDHLQIPSPEVKPVPIHRAFKGKSRFMKMWKRSGRNLQDQSLQNGEIVLEPVFIRHLDSPDEPIQYHGPRYEIIPEDSKPLRLDSSPKNEDINRKLREVTWKLSLLKSDLAGLNEELFKELKWPNSRYS